MEERKKSKSPSKNSTMAANSPKFMESQQRRPGQQIRGETAVEGTTGSRPQLEHFQHLRQKQLTSLYQRKSPRATHENMMRSSYDPVHKSQERPGTIKGYQIGKLNQMGFVMPVEKTIQVDLNREGLTTAVPKHTLRDSGLRIPTKPDFRSTVRHGSKDNGKRKFSHRKWEDPIELPGTVKHEESNYRYSSEKKQMKQADRQPMETIPRVPPALLPTAIHLDTKLLNVPSDKFPTSLPPHTATVPDQEYDSNLIMYKPYTKLAVTKHLRTEQSKQRSPEARYQLQQAKHYMSSTSTNMGYDKSSHPGIVVDTMGSEKQISETLVLPSSSAVAAKKDNNLNSKSPKRKKFVNLSRDSSNELKSKDSSSIRLLQQNMLQPRAKFASTKEKKDASKEKLQIDYDNFEERSLEDSGRPFTQNLASDVEFERLEENLMLNVSMPVQDDNKNMLLNDSQPEIMNEPDYRSSVLQESQIELYEEDQAQLSSKGIDPDRCITLKDTIEQIEKKIDMPLPTLVTETGSNKGSAKNSVRGSRKTSLKGSARGSAKGSVKGSAKNSSRQLFKTASQMSKTSIKGSGKPPQSIMSGHVAIERQEDWPDSSQGQIFCEIDDDVKSQSVQTLQEQSEKSTIDLQMPEKLNKRSLVKATRFQNNTKQSFNKSVKKRKFSRISTNPTQVTNAGIDVELTRIEQRKGQQPQGSDEEQAAKPQWTKHERLQMSSNAQAQQKETIWKPISEIKQSKLMNMQEKDALMNLEIQKIEEENKDYYRGKELRFDNAAHFFQCIVDPAGLGFIAAQSRNKIRMDNEDSEESSAQNSDDDASEDWVIWTETPFPKKQQLKLAEENTIENELGQKDDQAQEFSLQHMGEFVPDDEKDAESSESTIISFWRQKDAIAVGQHECFDYIVEEGVISVQTSPGKPQQRASNERKMISKQCLFTGMNKKVFFFTQKEDNAIFINIISSNQKKDDGYDSTSQHHGSQSSPQKAQNNEDHIDRDIDRYQVEAGSDLHVMLMKQLKPERKELSDANFCLPEPTLITHHNIDYLVLAALNAQNLPCLYFYSVTDQQQNALRIDGAEFLVDAESDTISYLTNDSNRAKPEQSRLLHTSYVIETNFDLLLSNELDDDMKTFELETDPETAMFFQTESHQFAYMQVASTHEKDLRSLTLFLYGRPSWPSVALYFRIALPESITKIQAGVFSGHYQSREDNIINVEGLEVLMQDKSGMELDTDRMDGEYYLRMRDRVDSWVPAKISQLSLPEQKPLFEIKSLEFDRETGMIINGEASISDRVYDLQPVEEVETHKFKLQFIRKGIKDPIAVIEGVYQNDPFNVHLRGYFYETAQAWNRKTFAIQQLTSAKLTIASSEITNEFNVLIQGGMLYDQENLIELTQSQTPCLAFDYVHRVVVVEDDTFIMHGNLSQQNQEKVGKRHGSNPDNMLKLTQVTQNQVKGGKTKTAVIDTKEMTLGSQTALQKIWYRIAYSTDLHLIQGLSINKSPLQITYAVLVPETRGFTSDTLKFVVKEEPRQEVASNALGRDKTAPRTLLTGVSEMVEAVEYPLIVYNSYLPNNSELIVTNIAEKEKESQVLNLGPLRFVTFISSPFLHDKLKNKHVKRMHCMVYFLAWHTKQEKLYLMTISCNPWQRKKQLHLHWVRTQNGIKIPPNSIENIRRVHLLMSKSATQKKDKKQKQASSGDHILGLIFQFDEELWISNLKTPDQSMLALDADTYKMKQRYMIHRPFDKDQIYCLAEKGTRDEVLRIRFDGDIAQVEAIYESSNAKLLALEPDPEDGARLFIIDEEQRAIVIKDNSNHDSSKVTIAELIDLSEHDLDMQFDYLQYHPWKSIVISQRVMSFFQTSYSLRSGLTWKIEKLKDRTLSSEVSLCGTLCSFQKWNINKDGSGIISCKPLPGTCLVDLIGQKRHSASGTSKLEKSGQKKATKTKLPKLPFLASQDNIMIQTEDLQLLMFDKDGYICYDDMCHPGTEDEIDCFSRDGAQIMKQSLMNSQYGGKFFLIRNRLEQHKDIKFKFTLVLNRFKGFSVVMKDYTDRWLLAQIKDQLQSKDNLAAELTKGMPAATASIEIQKIVNDASINDSYIQVKLKHSFLAADGQLTVIAAIQVPQLEKVPGKESQYEASNWDLFAKTASKGNLESDSFVRNQLFGFFKVDNIRVIMILVKNRKQSDKLQRCLDLQEITKSKMTRQRIKDDQKYNAKKRQSQAIQTDNDKDESSRWNKPIRFIFNLVGTKLVWLDTKSQVVQHVDLDHVFKNKEFDNKVSWSTFACRGFTVKEIFSRFDLTKDNKKRLDQGFFNIDEIPQDSILLKKKGRHFSKSIKNDDSTSSCLMQLTCGNAIVVYNLRAEERQEVAMIHEVKDFQDPVTFSHSGFVCNTSQRTLETSYDSSFGIQRPWPNKTGRVLFRAIAEIDLQQIKYLQQVIGQKGKAGINKIELDSLLRVYGDETIFTLFSEHTSVYEQIDTRLKQQYQLTSTKEEGEQESSFSIRSLQHVLDRPTPVHLRKNLLEEVKKQYCDLSILKQCLKFEGKQNAAATSTILIYKIAGCLDLYLSDFIDCMEDLKSIISLLPIQQYTPLLNKFEENLFTTGCIQATMQKGGNGSSIKTFTQRSAAIYAEQKELKEYKQNELKRPVTISVISMEDIRPFNSGTELFIFLRQHQSLLQGSLMLDALFSTFWQKQKQEITNFVFMPFLIFLIVANVYYTQCMFGTSIPQGIWPWFCQNQMNNCQVQHDATYWLRAIFGVLLFQKVLIEVYQLKKEGLSRYWAQATNKLDVFVLITNCLTLVLHAFADETNLSLTLLRQLAALGILGIWMQMFLWFRLFDSLAQYVDLMSQTIADIGYFMFVFGELMVMFMMCFYMLQITRIEQGSKMFDYNDEEENPSYMWYAFSNQILLTLGDFGSSHLHRSNKDFPDAERDYIDAENVLVYAIWIGSLFIGQIVVFNMLIAIMSETFGRHTDSLDENGKRQKLKLVSEYSAYVNWMRSIFCGNCRRVTDRDSRGASLKTQHLFIVTPRVDGEGQGEVETGKDPSQARFIRKALDEKFKEIDNFLGKKVMKSITDLQLETHTRLDVIERGTFSTRESIKRDTMQKFAEMKTQVSDRHKERTDQVVKNRNSYETSLQQMQEQLRLQLENYAEEQKEQKIQSKTIKKEMGSLEQLVRKRTNYH